MKFNNKKYTYSKPFSSVKHRWEILGPKAAIHFNVFLNEDLMTNWGSDFRIETKDLAATIQAGIMIEKFREALNAVDGEEEK